MRAECAGKRLVYNWRVYKGETFHLTIDLGERKDFPSAEEKKI